MAEEWISRLVTGAPPRSDTASITSRTPDQEAPTRVSTRTSFTWGCGGSASAAVNLIITGPGGILGHAIPPPPGRRYRRDAPDIGRPARPPRRLRRVHHECHEGLEGPRPRHRDRT